MDKMYRVFISSTYEDLQKERKEVIQALLGINCVPTGMEIFQATDDNQWDLIKKVINSCDYYIVIIGGRYGSIHPQTGKSYTQMEYEYALEIGIPILGFIYKDIKNLPWSKIDNVSKLESFIELVKKKMIRFWTTPEDLAKSVLLSFHKIVSTHPRTGWIRADEVNNQVALALELESQMNPPPSINVNIHCRGYWYSELLELANMSFGCGITAISNFFNVALKAHVPKIKITEVASLDIKLPANSYNISYTIQSPFGGSIILCIEKEFWGHYIKNFIESCENGDLFLDKEIQHYTYSGLFELCSMFSGAFASCLSDVVNSRIDIQKGDLLTTEMPKLFCNNDTILVASQEFHSEFNVFKSYFFVGASIFDQVFDNTEKSTQN